MIFCLILPLKISPIVYLGVQWKGKIRATPMRTNGIHPSVTKQNEKGNELKEKINIARKQNCIVYTSWLKTNADYIKLYCTELYCRVRTCIRIKGTNALSLLILGTDSKGSEFALAEET